MSNQIGTRERMLDAAPGGAAVWLPKIRSR